MISNKEACCFKPKFYFFLALIFGFITMAVLSNNLFIIICFMELAVVASAGLIGFKKIRGLGRPGLSLLVLNLVSFITLILGVSMVFLAGKTAQLNLLENGALSFAPAALISLGVFISWMQIPLFTRISELTDASCYDNYSFGWAFIVFAWQFLLLKIFAAGFPPAQAFLDIIIVLLLVWIFIWSAAALSGRSARRILPCILFGQAGYTMLAIFSGEARFAMLYILAQVIALTGIYLSAGLALNKIKPQLKPLAKTGFLLCAFSAMGIPPLLGFWPKFMTVAVSLGKGQVLTEVIAVALIIFALFYFIRLYNRIFSLHEASDNCCFGGVIMPWVVFALGLFSLVLGLTIRFVYHLLLLPIR